MKEKEQKENEINTEKNKTRGSRILSQITLKKKKVS